MEAQSRALAQGDGAAFLRAGEEFSAILSALAADPPREPQRVADLRAIRDRIAAQEDALRRTVQERGLQLQALLREYHAESRVIDRLV